MLYFFFHNHDTHIRKTILSYNTLGVVRFCIRRFWHRSQAIARALFERSTLYEDIRDLDNRAIRGNQTANRHQQFFFIVVWRVLGEKK